MENKRRLCLFISAVWITAREWPIGGKTPFKVVDCRGSHGHHSVSHTDWLKLPIREWVRSLICIDQSDLHLDQLIPNAKCFYDFIRHTESQWRSSRQELQICYTQITKVKKVKSEKWLNSKLKKPTVKRQGQGTRTKRQGQGTRTKRQGQVCMTRVRSTCSQTYDDASGEHAAIASPKEIVNNFLDAVAIGIQRGNALAVRRSVEMTERDEYRHRVVSRNHRVAATTTVTRSTSLGVLNYARSGIARVSRSLSLQ